MLTVPVCAVDMPRLFQIAVSQAVPIVQGRSLVNKLARFTPGAAAVTNPAPILRFLDAQYRYGRLVTGGAEGGMVERRLVLSQP